MAQQTAVEWLIEQYMKDGFFKREAYEKAKAMEKEQIENAHNSGFEEGHKHVKSNYMFLPKDGLQYYNETYGEDSN